ncbi:hypothetical protein Taro_045021 [Colocasia esculenta]|uniref:Uncharacterized protein n=1 Tax=Colocasia esculenta TaxID=4460 RepID=A0A843X3L2_COLES|nr:hypothetical protein [Colocasia esculenta]
MGRPLVSTLLDLVSTHCPRLAQKVLSYKGAFLVELRMQNMLPHLMTGLEKVIAACEEKNLTNSSDPSILTPILDDVYNGHHGGYERGRGLGWSRGAWRHNMSNEASNENEIDNMHAREREMEARQQEHMEAVLARERELEMRQQKQEEAMEVREREMLSQIQQMKDMLSMFVFSDSVGDLRSRAWTSHVRYNSVQRDCFDNREKLFSIQFAGRQIHVEERRPPSSSAAQEILKFFGLLQRGCEEPLSEPLSLTMTSSWQQLHRQTPTEHTKRECEETLSLTTTSSWQKPHCQMRTEYTKRENK